MNFNQTPEFSKDLKRLVKKWRSLPNDLEVVKPQILDLYVGGEGLAEFRAAFFNGKRATIVTSTEKSEVVKMRLDVESLPVNSKVRLVFVAVKTQDTIIFVELYAKNEKNRENPARYRTLI